MPSFDIVSEIDMQEVRNAVETPPAISAPAGIFVQQLLDILREKLSKRSIDGAALEIPEEFTHSGKTYSVEAKLKQGLKPLWRRKSSS
ncbi:UPF0234 protein Spro_1084-like [Nilaparvata lugens]|uniref:UPF0234 protein Spro_1084-like n=1 Tax=Nilaparvata lugens TaxID=108931 RepID=UPI00193DEABB|nr:UPF0234 protein Spro_1084-like [Nilaparvata lugens]